MRDDYQIAVDDVAMRCRVAPHGPNILVLKSKLPISSIPDFRDVVQEELDDLVEAPKTSSI